MDLFRRMFIAAAVAGVLSGLFIGIVHQFTTVQIIYGAEVFEQGADESYQSLVHEAHTDRAWEPQDGLERISYTVLADLLSGIGFSLLLVAAYAVAGAKMDARKGLTWGAAAFIVFLLAPGLGLPPEVPGTSAAPLASRQLWWVSTVMLTAIALVLLSRRPAHPLAYIVALVLIALPHAIGAPQPAAFQSTAPEPLAHRFVVETMMSGLLFWLVAGTLTGLFYQHLVQSGARIHYLRR